jgi:hypothetical protein
MLGVRALRELIQERLVQLFLAENQCKSYREVRSGFLFLRHMSVIEFPKLIVQF